MKTLTSSLFAFAFVILFQTPLFAQSVIINGKIENVESKEAVPAASIIIKGGTTGTFSDSHGNFKLPVTQSFPITLIISSIGYETQELVVENANSTVQINLKQASAMGTEVVVSATRSQIRSLESPVSIERMSSAYIRQVPAPSFMMR